MTELWKIGTGYRHTPQLGLSSYFYQTLASADAGDTLTISLGTMGMTEYLGHREWIHPTFESVIKPVDGSNISLCAVSSRIFTGTLGTGDNMRRVFEIIGR